MKLAFLLFEYFPYGGLQRDMLAIAREAQSRGQEVTVFTRAWHGEPEPGLAVETLPVHDGMNHVRDDRFARQVRDRLEGFDSVVGFNKMPGLDWYYAADGCLAARYRGVRRWLSRYRDKLAKEAAVFRADVGTRILSISPPQRALYQRYYGTAGERFVDLPPGIRRDRILPEDYASCRQRLRAGLGLAEDTPMLLFVGSGFRTKGLDRAIALLPDLPERIPLYVVGDDNPAPYLRRARRLGVRDRVHFMGGQDNVAEWLWSADLLVHPAYAENTGTVLLEAAVAGLPVLTTPVCGYAPYIERANMGRVSAEPSATDVNALMTTSRDQWRQRGRAFAESADIYDLVRHAVDAIERYPRKSS